MNISKCFKSLIILLAFSFFAASDSVDVLMCHMNPWILGTSSEWEFVKKNVDIIKLYIDQVHQADIEDVRNLVNICKENDIKIVVELAGLADWRAGDTGSTGESMSAELSFKDEYDKFRKITDPEDQGGCGGSIAYLDFDGPMRRMFYPSNKEMNFHTLQSATDELIEVMQLWKNQYPETELMLLTNFPCWGWKKQPAYFSINLSPAELGYGDYYTVLQTIFEKTDSAGISFAGVTVDNPYHYALGDHETNQANAIAGINFLDRLLDIEKEVESRGLQFNMITNTEAGNTSSELFCEETIQFLDTLLAIGMTPKVWDVQSWYKFPSQWVPEDDSSTMTNLVKNIINKLDNNVALKNPETFTHNNADIKIEYSINQTIQIQFTITKSDFIRIHLFNLSGQVIKTLVKKRLQPGVYSICANKEEIMNGIYLFAFHYGNQRIYRKCAIMN